MRKRYRQDSETGKLVEIYQGNRIDIHAIGAEFEPFLSPVDGTYIESRQALEEHNKRNHVRPAEEYQDQIKARTRRKEAVHGAGHFDTSQRIESLKLAYELHQSNRPESDRRQILDNFIQHQQHGRQHE